MSWRTVHRFSGSAQDPLNDRGNLMKPIRRFRSKIVTAFVGYLLIAAAGSADRGPSTPEERARALELVELLETQPSAPEAKDAKKWLLGWLIEIPDITVNFCVDTLGTPEELKGVPADLTVHQAFAQAAFFIRNPEARSGSTEAYVAGVEGALRAYESMKAAGTVAAIPVFEEMLKKEASGELEKVVKKRVKKCK